MGIKKEKVQGRSRIWGQVSLATQAILWTTPSTKNVHPWRAFQTSSEEVGEELRAR